MRVVASVVVLLCGCNEVYGLEATSRRDAAFFDGMTDPPPECPPIGTPPRFSRRLRQVVTKPCFDLGVARTGRMLATCVEDGNFKTFEGVLDATTAAAMTPAAGFDVPNLKYAYPRIAPDGESAIVRVEDGATVTFEEFVRDPAAWTSRSQITVPGMFTTTATTANRHVLVGVADEGLHELVDDGLGFKLLRLHDKAQLALESFSNFINLTGDGLRLLVLGRLATGTGYQMLYSDRADDTAAFAPMQPLPNYDTLNSGAFMSDDCGQLYLAGLSYVFAAELER